MFFTGRKGVKRAEPIEPTSREFVLKGTIQSMSEMETPIDGRKACVIELFSEEPILVNGETEHRFWVYIPNYTTDPRFNYDRMKFWLCYGHQQPVMLDEHEEPIVPLLDKRDFDYFLHRTFYFNAQVVQFGNGKEIVDVDYSPKR